MKHILAIMLLVITVGSMTAIYGQDNPTDPKIVIDKYPNFEFKNYPALDVGYLTKVIITDVNADSTSIVISALVAGEKKYDILLNDENVGEFFNESKYHSERITHTFPINTDEVVNMQIVFNTSEFVYVEPENVENIATVEKAKKVYSEKVVLFTPSKTIMTELPVSTPILDLDYFEFVGFTNMTNYEVYDGTMVFDFTASGDLHTNGNLPVGTSGDFKWTAHTQKEKSGFTIDNQADFESKITIVKDYPYIEITPQTALGDKAERIFLHLGT